MIAPAALVLISPLVMGFLFGSSTVAGYLAGAIFSGVQMAISMSTSGSGWVSAKNYIERGNFEFDEETQGIGSKTHKASVIGDTVGDPMKDTSAPSLNILVKLMAIVCLVCAPFIDRTSILEAWILHL